MWNVFEDKFIHNDAQYEAVLIVWGLIDKDYASLEAKELYTMLTSIEVAEIERRKTNERISVLR